MDDKTALLIIGMQLSFFENDPVVYRADAVLNNIKILVNKARHGRAPVIYIQHDTEPEINGPIHPLIAPSEKDIVVFKHTPGAFYETNLKQILDRFRVDNLLITGFQSDMCVEATCCEAIDLGYNVILVIDAHSTYDAPPLTAAQIIAKQNAKLSERVQTIETIGVKFTRGSRAS